METLDNLLLSKLPQFQYASHLEAQERACNLLEIVRIVERQHAERAKVGDALAALLEGELNPVAAKAQRRVPVPEKWGVVERPAESRTALHCSFDLDAWIVEPEPDSDEDEDDDGARHDDDATIDQARRQFAIAARSYAEGESDDEAAVDEVGEEALPASPASPVAGQRGSRVATKSERDRQRLAAADERRQQRAAQLAENPYYVKAAAGAPSKRSPLVVKSRANETSAKLDNPLQIPGAIEKCCALAIARLQALLD